jgi:hypothetical protein
MTSPDGITWTSRASAADNGWVSVCWSPELKLFVAVAYNVTGDRVMTSPDGITWTGRTAAGDNDWASVCWSPELGMFAAVASAGVGSKNKVMTSMDGSVWEIQTTPTDKGWSSIVWSQEISLFVAVSYTGGSSPNDRVMTSPDGITWTASDAAAEEDWRSVCWSPELSMFAAVSESYAVNGVMTWQFGKLAITLTETIGAVNFKAHAIVVGGFTWLGKAVGQSPGFNLPTLDSRPCYVTIAPDMGNQWIPSTYYAVDDLCFPTDPATTPYYYKRLVAGTSGATEPTWLTTPAATVDDDAVTGAWELVERMVQPVTHGPLVPA